jgi:hypothetical protein
MFLSCLLLRRPSPLPSDSPPTYSFGPCGPPPPYGITPPPTLSPTESFGPSPSVRPRTDGWTSDPPFAHPPTIRTARRGEGEGQEYGGAVREGSVRMDRRVRSPPPPHRRSPTVEKGKVRSTDFYGGTRSLGSYEV